MPPEVRNQIYQYVIDTNPSDYFLHDNDEHKRWDCLEFSRTCHQIFAETASRYHAMKLQPVSDMRHWLLYSTNYIPNFILFTPSQTSAISQVTSHWGIVSHKHRSWDRLKRLAGLKKLI
jgi:hypothetical protein